MRYTKKIKTIMMILCLIMILGLTACQNKANKAPEITYEEASTRVEKLLENMSVDEKIGQVLLMNFRKWEINHDTEIPAKDAGKVPDTEELNDEILEIVKAYHIGNIILFGESTKTTEMTIQQTNKYQQAAKENGDIPLIIAIDQEGGSVTRILQGTRMPGNMALAATNDVEYAIKTGKILGMEMAACGINLNFGPVVDVNSNRYNPIIGLRSFGSDPKLVGDYGVAYAKGLKEENIISSAKHFPGHGDTDTDTHTGLALVNKTYDEWYACEAVPFVRMINEKVPVIMSAHIQYPQLDSTQVISKSSGEKIYLPATVSKKILTGILREKLGYEGVICTDAMDMAAISDHFGTSEAIIMALNAGVDMLCNPVSVRCKGDVNRLTEVYDAIKAAINDGTLSEKRLDEAVLRILKLKEAYGILDYEIKAVNETINNANIIIANDENRQIEREISEKAVVHYGDAKKLEIHDGETVLFMVPYASEGFSIEFAVNRLRKENAIPDIKLEKDCYNKLEELTPKLLEKIHNADHVVVISEANAAALKDENHWLSKMPKLILKEAKNAAIISAGLPYDVKNYEGYPVYVIFGNDTMLEEDSKTGVITGYYGPNFPAGVGAVLGTFEATGVMPVKVD